MAQYDYNYNIDAQKDMTYDAIVIGSGMSGQALGLPQLPDSAFLPPMKMNSAEEGQSLGFYRSFKSLAIRGYCTSKEIGSEVLKYEPIPGPYQGCIPFEDVGKVYSL